MLTIGFCFKPNCCGAVPTCNLPKYNQDQKIKPPTAITREDREVLLAAVRVDDDALQWASTDLLADRGVVLEAVRRQMRPDPTKTGSLNMIFGAF